MDDPAKLDWRGKIETRASSLAGGLLFLRLIRLATASKSLFICAHPSHPWSKCFWVIGSHRQPLQCFEGKIFRNLLEAFPASAYPKMHAALAGLESQAE
jgi:hypothetical protein